jgi:hypothetical protein
MWFVLKYLAGRQSPDTVQPICAPALFQHFQRRAFAFAGCHNQLAAPFVGNTMSLAKRYLASRPSTQFLALSDPVCNKDLMDHTAIMSCLMSPNRFSASSTTSESCPY